MAKLLSEFKKVDGLDDVFTAENGSLRCSAIRLTTGGLCLFSPVLGLGKEAVASLAHLGNVDFLLAPNHYHNKGLLEYGNAFPKAVNCALPEAHPRLEKMTGSQFQDLNTLQTLLPNNMHLVFPPGLKTGEVWIKVMGTGQLTWLVVDAFSGPKGKAGKTASEPQMLGTFPKFGVADRTRYLGWVTQKVKMDKPTMIVPCHGNIVCSPDLAHSLQLLIQERFC